MRRIAIPIRCIMAGTTLYLLVAAAAAAPGNHPGGDVVETITSQGTGWVCSTWGYNTPKLVYDGKRSYAIGLVDGPGGRVAQLYARGPAGWTAGATFSPVHQPATILLDDHGCINVFSSDLTTGAHHWRSATAGDVNNFATIPIPDARKFRYGYLGVGTDGHRLALAGLDSNYSMWLAVKPSFEAAWNSPCLVARGQQQVQPWDAPVYPIVMPDAGGVHIIYSNCPDGGIHNTYDKVQYLYFDNATRQVTTREIVAQGPLGTITFGLDALFADDGTVYALYFTGLYVYGEKPSGDAQPHGVYCAVRLAPGKWRTTKVTDSTGAAQLFRDPDGTLHVLQSTPTGIVGFSSTDGGRSWKPAKRQVVSPAVGAFLYVVKANSGSVIDRTVRAIHSHLLPEAVTHGNQRHALEFITITLPPAQ